MKKAILLLITIISLTSCNESADSLRKKACNCFQKARKLNNSDAMMSKLQECTDLQYESNQALIDQAKREDWSDEKQSQMREELYKKYDCDK